MRTVGAPSPLRSPASPEPRATILIVEDHADTRDAMGVLVTELGYRAVLTANGTEALAVLQSNRADLILCDVRMPGLRGTATRLLAAGFDGHLVKPLDYDVLLAALDRILWMPPKC